MPNRLLEGWAVCHLGIILHLQGDFAGAADRYKESQALLQEVGDTMGVGHQLANLANVARDMGDYPQAARLHRESLVLRRALLDQPGFAESLEGLAVCAAGEGQPYRAARLFGAAERLRETIGRTIELADRFAHERAVSTVRINVGAELFVAAWAEGQTMPLQEALDYALAEPAEKDGL